MGKSTEYTFPGYILVTGAGSGIGLSIVETLLSSGIKKIICQYRKRNTELFELFYKYNMDPINYTLQAELTNEEDVAKIRQFGNQKFDNIYGLLNVAGASTNGMSWKLSKENFMDIISFNLLSTFLCTKEFTSDMRTRSMGRIINFSSIVAFTGTIGSAHYCAAKAGIVGFSKAIALELANKNITVNTVALGYFNRGLINDVPETMKEDIKDKTPMKRLGEAEEVGSLIKYLLSADTAFITGQVLHINGGLY